MQIPVREELIDQTLRAIRALGGSASIAEIDEKVVENLQLPEEIAGQPHGTGRQTEIKYRLGWARTYLKNHGLITNSDRGVWALTPEGVKAEAVEPREVVRSVRQQLGLANQIQVDEDDVDKVVEDASDETASWREDLLETLMNMPPDAFERLCQRLLRESGFIAVEVTGRSGDGGIDGRGVIRVAGLISFTVLFQCKRYRDNVGPSVVRDFRGAMMGRADKGLLITTGGFTRDAQVESRRDGASPIDLIDGELLVRKLKELKLGVRTQMVEAVEVDREWFKSI